MKRRWFARGFVPCWEKTPPECPAAEVQEATLRVRWCGSVVAVYWGDALVGGGDCSGTWLERILRMRGAHAKPERR